MASKELEKLGKDYWEFVLKTYPTWATFLGDPRYNGRLEEFGPQIRKKQRVANQAFLKRLKKIKLDKLTQREKVTYRILELKLKEFIDAQKFKDWEWNLDQLSGPHLQLMDLLDIHPLKTKKNYDDLLKRYKAIPKHMSQYLGDLRDGLKSGRVAPYVAYDRVVGQVQKFVQMNPLETRFAEPLKKFPKSFSKKDQQKYSVTFEKTIRADVMPAYEKFLKFLQTEYKDRARQEVGVSAIPNGRENYAFRVRVNTTTDKTPEELHQVGLEELQKNKEEILAIAQSLGHTGDVKSFLEKIKADRSNYYETSEQLIEGHNTALNRMKTLLARYLERFQPFPLKSKKWISLKRLPLRRLIIIRLPKMEVARESFG